MRNQLILVRHAKAKKPAVSHSDAKRPLTRRGREDARIIARDLDKQGFRPDLIWTSPARRALETACILAKRLGYKRRHIRIDERLYATTATTLLRLIRRLDRQEGRVVLCGHNPELLNAANRLGAELDSLPTSGWVQLKFDVRDWSKVAAANLARLRSGRPGAKPTKRLPHGSLTQPRWS